MSWIFAIGGAAILGIVGVLMYREDQKSPIDEFATIEEWEQFQKAFKKAVN
jgi:hypothetical protein